MQNMLISDIRNRIKCAFNLAVHRKWLVFNRSSKAFVKNADPVRCTMYYWFIALVICCLKSGVVFSSLKSVNNRLTLHSHSGKQGWLGYVTGTTEMPCGGSLRSIHFIFLNASLCWMCIFCGQYLLFHNILSFCHRLVHDRRITSRKWTTNLKQLGVSNQMIT